ncbi:MAG: formimidoylglutamase [Chitinophagaceae bacterium]
MPFYSLDTIIDFLDPVCLVQHMEENGFRKNQLGDAVKIYCDQFPEIENADIIFLGCGEFRGEAGGTFSNDSPNAIREEFYNLYQWHEDLEIADVGNIKMGATMMDTYAAMQTVVSELLLHGKRVVILGGSHDLTIAQYDVYAKAEKIIELVNVDAKINIDMEKPAPAENFLMQVLTSEPNFVRHYNHIGFQSYYVHPGMLETIDKLRFDCYRLGKIKENVEEMEPVIRNAALFSFDISAIQYCHAPANQFSPNGFTGEEACMLMQYAGMSSELTTLGIYGFHPNNDVQGITAKQISQMLWYLMDGIYKGQQESVMENSIEFNEYKIAFADIESLFLQSKRTGRWWMKMPDGRLIACSHNDYIVSTQNEIPERWMRAMERN